MYSALKSRNGPRRQIAEVFLKLIPLPSRVCPKALRTAWPELTRMHHVTRRERTAYKRDMVPDRDYSSILGDARGSTRLCSSGVPGRVSTHKHSVTTASPAFRGTVRM